MPLSPELQKELEVLEQQYFSIDEPVPFKGDIKIYPVMVKDYYKFYSNLSCLTMDKTIKRIKVTNEAGEEEIQEVSNPQGIGMSYMAYLIDMMENKEVGGYLTAQVIALFELIFHEENGLFCSQCGHFIPSSEVLNAFQDFDKSVPDGTSEADYIVLKTEFLRNLFKCPECENELKEVFRIKNSQPIKKLCIKEEELSPKDLDRLIAIVTHQNILDYEADQYMDPTLRKDMELKRQLENKNYAAPSLEKMLICVSISSPYTIDMLKEQITLRKLSYMLKVIDAKGIYYAQIQGAMSGMVSFKEDPKHWIFSNDKKDMSKEIMDVNDFQKKLASVT